VRRPVTGTCAANSIFILRICSTTDLELWSLTVTYDDGYLDLLCSLAVLDPRVGKGKVFPYSLPSVGPGADPSVQAVSPQVT